MLPALLLRDEAPTAGPFDVFDKGVGKHRTGVYVFCINPHTGKVHVAFGRKIPRGRRVPFWWSKANPGKTAAEAVAVGVAMSGSAGTNEEYWGKWASLGGGSDPKARYPLDAARIELNDEAAVQPALQKWEIFVPGQGTTYVKGYHRATLVHADQPHPASKTFVFVFKWEDWGEFNALFPDVDTFSAVRGGQNMVTLSHGEIDYCQSFTLEQIEKFHMMSKAKSVTESNFFTRYTLSTFLWNAGPAIARHLRFLVKHRGQTHIQMFDIEGTATKIGAIDPDTTDRVPDPNGWRDKDVPIYM